MGGLSSAGAHDFGIFHNLYKNKNSNKITFDGVINLKLSQKQDIDMKNESCDFYQNLTSWRHFTPDDVIPAPVGLATWQPGRRNFILEHAVDLKLSHKVDID